MKRVLIIGASSGIGRELAELLASKGITVIAAARRQEELKDLAQFNEEHIRTCPLDVTSTNLEEMLDTVGRDSGPLDTIIYSAGQGELNEQLDFDLETPSLDVNIKGFTRTMVWAYNYFRSTSGGTIVGITSIGGIRGNRIAPAYNASKAYQINYLEGLRAKSYKEKENIRVIDYRPGSINTAMMKGDGHFWISSPGEAAEQLYKTIRSNKQVAHNSTRWAFVAGVLKILPRSIYKRF